MTCASLTTPLNEELLRKPYAGNLHVRFDEEEGSGKPDPPYSTGVLHPGIAA